MSKDNVTRRDLAMAIGAAALLPAATAMLPSGAQAATAPGALAPGFVSNPSNEPPSPNRKYPLKDFKEGQTIPGEYYTDEKWYARDETYLRDNYWWLVDHEDRIPKPGDFFLFQYGRGDSVIIARDDKGVVNGFHNVCQHRGSRLCLHDENLPSEAGPGGKRPEATFSIKQLGQEGNTSVFRCPYHAWTYDLNGKLVSVPGDAKFAPEGFKLAEHGLHPAHVRLVDGFIFVSLAVGNPPPLQLPQGGMHPKLKIAARRTTPTKANWKLVLENFAECYHCGPAHSNSYVRAVWIEDQTQTPAQVAAIGEDAKKMGYVPADYEAFLATNSRGYAYSNATKAAGGGGMSSYNAPNNRPRRLRPDHIAMTVDGKPAVNKLLPGYTERGVRPVGGHWGAQVGGLMEDMNGLITSDDYALIYRFIPRGVAATDVELIWLVHPDAVEGKDYDVRQLVGLWHNTVREDRWVAENNHVGLLSSRYSLGGGQPYMPSENSPAAFVAWYLGEVVPSMVKAEKKA